MSIRMTEEEYQKYLERHKAVILSYSPSLHAPKKSKYRNKKVIIDGITFDSKKEGEKYRQLKQLEQAGQITDLTLQPVFELAPTVTINGKKKRSLRYIADFQYIENGKEIVMDVKGMLTEIYKIKRHLMKSVLGIEILEV